MYFKHLEINGAMAAQILLNILVCLGIILLAHNVKSEDDCTLLRSKYGIGIDTNKCQLGNVTAEHGTFSCIEKCINMSEVRN